MIDSAKRSLDKILAANQVKVLAYLFIAALAVRFVYLSEYATSPFFWVPQMDSLYNDQEATRIAAGHAARTVYWRAPGYSHFLAAIYRVFGHSYWAARMTQMVLGSISCSLLYAIGARIFRPTVAVIAAIAMALYGPLIFNDGELQSPALEVVLDMSALLVGVLAMERRSARYWALAGILIGLSAIVRPTILVCLPIFLLFLWRSQSRDAAGMKRYRPAFAAAALFVGASLIAPLAVTTRNAIVARDAVFIASQGGINLWIGNRAGADGFTPTTPQLFAYTGAYQDSIELFGQRAAEAALHRPLKPSESSRYWTAQAVGWWKAHPADAARLAWKKLVLTWSRRELRDNVAYTYVRDEWTPVLRVCLIGFWIAGPLGLLGIILAWKTEERVKLLAAYALVYMVSFCVFFAAERFRLPIVPILLLFGAYAGVWLVEQIRAPKIRVLAPALVAIACFGMIVNIDWYRTESPAIRALDYWSAGNRLTELRHYPEAVAQYRKAASIDPKNADIWLNMGTATYYGGSPADAVPLFQTAAALSPSSSAYYDMGMAELQMGDKAAAARMLDRALALDPHHPGAPSARAGLK